MAKVYCIWKTAMIKLGNSKIQSDSNWITQSVWDGDGVGHDATICFGNHFRRSLREDLRTDEMLDFSHIPLKLTGHLQLLIDLKRGHPQMSMATRQTGTAELTSAVWEHRLSKVRSVGGRQESVDTVVMPLRTLISTRLTSLIKASGTNPVSLV